MTNAEIAKRLFELQVATKRKNALFAATFDRAIESILGSEVPVARWSADRLQRLKGVGPAIAQPLRALIVGEAIDSIVLKHVPAPGPRGAAAGGSPHRETGEWSGSWDNTIKTHEGG